MWLAYRIYVGLETFEWHEGGGETPKKFLWCWGWPSSVAACPCVCIFLLAQNHYTWFLFSPDLPLHSYFSFTFLYRSLTPFLEKPVHQPQPFTYYCGTPAALQTGLYLPVRVQVWLSFSVVYREKGKMPPLLRSSEFIGWIWAQPH